MSETMTAVPPEAEQSRETLTLPAEGGTVITAPIGAGAGATEAEAMAASLCASMRHHRRAFADKTPDVWRWSILREIGALLVALFPPAK